jgi:hypothetical protein
LIGREFVLSLRIEFGEDLARDEVAQLLREVADSVQAEDACSGTIRDANGEEVGDWSVKKLERSSWHPL